MKAGRFAEAEQVYREDLKRLPENGWSLYGLAESLREQKKNDKEVNAAKAKFQKCWAKADLKITTSCLCQARGSEELMKRCNIQVDSLRTLRIRLLVARSTSRGSSKMPFT